MMIGQIIEILKEEDSFGINVNETAELCGVLWNEVKKY